MTVGIYIRVSTEEQVKEGYSISAQRERLKAYCVAQGWDDFKFYVDEGISAKNIERPQLRLMLDHIKQGMIKIVLVYKLDRLTRSVRDLYKLLDIFEEYDCKFKSATEIYDTTTAMGRMFITIVAALAQWERENLGERVRMGQIEKARQGEYAAKAPFGFDKDINHKLIVNADEADVVYMMIDRLKEGSSIRKIADYLNELNIPPIRGYKWHLRTILNVLHNHALYGAVQWSGEIVESVDNEALIEKKEFEVIQKLLRSRQNLKKRETHSIFIYQMKLVCPTCGNRLTCERRVYKRKRDKSVVESNHYRCQVCALNKRQAIGVSEKKIEKALLLYMSNDNFDVDPEVQKDDEQNKELEQLNYQLKKIERQREKYQKAWADDRMLDEEFNARMDETKEVMIELKKKKESIQPQKSEKVDVNKLKEIATDFKLNWSYMSQDIKKKFMNTIIEGIEFEKEEGSVTVTNVRFY